VQQQMEKTPNVPIDAIATHWSNCEHIKKIPGIEDNRIH